MALKQRPWALIELVADFRELSQTAQAIAYLPGRNRLAQAQEMAPQTPFSHKAQHRGTSNRGMAKQPKQGRARSPSPTRLAQINISKMNPESSGVPNDWQKVLSEKQRGNLALPTQTQMQLNHKIGHYKNNKASNGPTLALSQVLSHKAVHSAIGVSLGYQFR